MLTNGTQNPTSAPIPTSNPNGKENENDGGNNQDNNYEIYLSSTQEVDAYNYQYEYLLTQMSGYNDNFRENVMFGLCAILEADADLALETMHKTGGKFINE
jgi:hypothetical protein